MYLLSVQTYLDQHFKCYKDIITINIFPNGPLGHIVSRITKNKLSTFQQNSPCCSESNCILAIKSINKFPKLMCIDELPSLITFLSNNGYEIDTNITRLMLESHVKLNNKILFFIKYKEN